MSSNVSALGKENNYRVSHIQYMSKTWGVIMCIVSYNNIHRWKQPKSLILHVFPCLRLHIIMIINLNPIQFLVIACDTIQK